MSSEGAGWRAVAVDEVESVRWQGTELVWRPLRHALGARAAGMAAYTAERPGQEIVEAHTEESDGRGHEEVYVVLRGRARFTLGDQALEASAGTAIRVDPHVYRHAVATEAGTAVLAIGAPPVFEPSASEWVERARSLARTDRGAARAVLDELRAAKPGSPALDVGEALLALVEGESARATELLRLAVERIPDLREQLAGDPDLGPLAADV